MQGYARLKQTDQILVHVFEFVRNVQTNKPLACKLMAELILQPSDMLLLHGKNQIRPANMPCCNLNPGILFRARRSRLMAAGALKNRLRRQAPPLVSAAYE